MADFRIRRAASQDFPAIRRLIRQARINPMALDWHRFVVAVDVGNRLLGCGQLKPHGGGITELASIAVLPDYRQRGIARALIEDLIATAPRPLYLTCRSSLKSFYEKWQFRALELPDMPPYYRKLVRAMSMVGKLFMRDERLLVMALK